MDLIQNRDPAGVRRSDLPPIPRAADLAFPGFDGAALGILDRLRKAPHIEQYRLEKKSLAERILEPFKAYRDDLAVYWVLPARLALETERNVFSRVLKNDFGAGGSHHHVWMAFYRPGLRRLRDIQLAHSIWPDGFRVSLYIGQSMGAVFGPCRDLLRDPAFRRTVMAPLADGDRYSIAWQRGARRIEGDELGAWLAGGLPGMTGAWVSRRWTADSVVSMGPDLIFETLGAVHDLWPLYRALLEASAGALRP